jgi:hypothetical protein
MHGMAAADVSEPASEMPICPTSPIQNGDGADFLFDQHDRVEPRWRLSTNDGGWAAQTPQVNPVALLLDKRKESPPISGRAKSGRIPQARSVCGGVAWCNSQ